MGGVRAWEDAVLELGWRLWIGVTDRSQWGSRKAEGHTFGRSQTAVGEGGCEAGVGTGRGEAGHPNRTAACDADRSRDVCRRGKLSAPRKPSNFLPTPFPKKIY